MLREECCSGLADGSYSVSFVGRTAQALLDSADGRADFTWRNGALSHFALPVVLRTRGAKPVAAQSSLHFSAFQGHAELHSRSLKLSTSKIATPNGIYQVAGNVALDHTVKLTLACGTQRFGIAGTIDAPEIAAEHATEVAAPPQPTATPIASKSGPGAN
jgi:uncharacterized protein involved in outer membrane biogenesis